MARALPAPAAPRRAAWLSRAAQAAYAAGGALAAVQLLRLGTRLVRAQVRRNGALWAAGAHRQSSLWTYFRVIDSFICDPLHQLLGIRYSTVRLHQAAPRATPEVDPRAKTPLEEDNTPTGCLNAVGIRVSGRYALSSSR